LKTKEKIRAISVGDVIALTLAIVFFGSYLYNIGFFYAANIGIDNLYALPISFNDIANSFLFWLPVSIFIIITLLVVGLLSEIFDRDVPEEYIGSGKSVSYFRKTPYYTIIVAIIFAIYVYISSSFSIYTINLSLNKRIELYSIGAALYILLVIARNRGIEKERISDVFFVPEFLLIIFLIGAFSSGYISGGSLKEKYSNVIIKEDDLEKEFSIIRVLEKGIIVKSIHEEFEFYSWQNIVKVNIPPKPMSGE